MRIFLGMILAVLSAALFLPGQGSTQIRNLPLLLAVVSFLLVLILVRCLKYMILILKAKKILREKGFERIGFHVVPFTVFLTFRCDDNDLNVAFFTRKKRQQHCFFKDINNIEFYRSNRVVFRNIKVKGATISNLVEDKLVGKRRIRCNSFLKNHNNKTIFLFDKLPYRVTDSSQRQELGNGDVICSSNVVLYDLKGIRGCQIL